MDSEVLFVGGGFFLTYFGWIFGVVRCVRSEDKAAMVKTEDIDSIHQRTVEEAQLQIDLQK